MNKLLLLALVGFAFIALSGAEEQEAEGNLQEAYQAQVAESREVRDADPARSKKERKGKKGKKNGKKVRKGKKNQAKKNKKRKSKKNRRQGKRIKKNKKKSKRKGKKQKNKKNKKRKNRKRMKKNKSKKNKNKRNKKKKGKKSKRKNKNKSKKNKKSKKAKKSKNAKKTKLSGRTCGRAVSDECLDKAVTYMKILKDKVGNFKRQFTRIGKQNKTGGKKSGKKDVFKGALTRLIESGGGNVSALSCGGSTDNAGAKQLNNLTSTLKKCSDDIKKACDPSNLPKPNLTEANACNKTMTTFTTKVDECRKKTGTEACTCWTSTDLTTMEKKIKTCALSKKANEMADAIKKCRNAFGKCRKYEDAVGTVIHSCAVSKKALLAKLKSLKKNKKKLEELKDKLSALSKKTMRATRQTITCATVITTSQTIITFVKQNPASTLIFTQASTVTSVTVTCTSTEKTQITTLIVQVSASILSIERETAAVQENFKELTGNEATDAEIETGEECINSDCSPIDEDDSSNTATTAAGATTSTAATTPKPVATTKAPAVRKRFRKSVEDILKSKLV